MYGGRRVATHEKDIWEDGLFVRKQQRYFVQTNGDLDTTTERLIAGINDIGIGKESKRINRLISEKLKNRG